MRNGNHKLRLLRQMTLSQFRDVDLALDRMAGRIGTLERSVSELKKDVGGLRKALRGTAGKIGDLFDYVGEVDTILSQHRSNKKVHVEVE